jgi:chromosome segregation ATPase
MIADAVFIWWIEEGLEQNCKTMSALLKEIESAEEEMRMHEKNLAAFCYEEKTTNSEDKLKELKNSIQEEIINLLLKRRTLNNLETELEELRDDLSVLNEKLDIVHNLKNTIETLWGIAIDAGRNV